MMKRKKGLILLLALTMIFSLAACGGNEQDKGEGAGAGAGEASLDYNELYQGVGVANLHREDLGEDGDGNPIYSFNQIFVNAIFDENDRIIDLFIDQLEVGSPNMGKDISRFNGYPGQEGYDWADKYENTEDSFQEEVEAWTTKRELGEAYKLESGTWAEQMVRYEEEFIGMTPREVIEWSNKYSSDLSGRPVTEDSDEELDRNKYEALAEDEKEMLDDLTSVATISLNDSNGNILIAISNALDNKTKIDADSLKAQGIGFVSKGSTSPSKDEDGNEIYLIDEVVASTILDGEGRIASIHVDHLEILSDGDGDNISVLRAFPGQMLMNDEEEVYLGGDFRQDIYEWASKRQLGDSYRLDSGTWAEQMDKIEEALIGKNKEEVEEFAKEYSENEDLVSGATIAITGDQEIIIESILKSFDRVKEIDVEL